MKKLAIKKAYTFIWALNIEHLTVPFCSNAELGLSLSTKVAE
jgi:hypothetical protein